MNNLLSAKTVSYLLRLAVFGEFLGHGLFAVQGKAQWVEWVSKLFGVDATLATQILLVIGTLDIIVALFVLLKPNKPILLWAIFWGFSTALMRLVVGEPFLDFVERWANWGAPLALLYFVDKEV